LTSALSKKNRRAIKRATKYKTVFLSFTALPRKRSEQRLIAESDERNLF